ncbi:alpha/beta hydrolase, partial [Candidatus Falkowbacteria bacterium]|nr:alpha/beta hydrolase [Candidatus Falkowbacteria bacterium]
KIKRLIIISTVIIFLVYTGLGLFLWGVQKSLIYFPSRQDFDSCLGFADSEKLNLNGTRAYFKKNSGKLVVFYHGNAGSACMRTYLKGEFEKVGVSYLIVEYAGFSNDKSKPDKKLLMKDVENVNDFLAGKKFTQIIVVGESLGTALATYHSTLMPIDKLLLISPFYRMVDMAQANYPIYPMSLLLTEDYDSDAWIKASKAKSLEILHGSADEVVPIDQSKKLFESARITDKKYVEVAGAHHNDIYNFKETFDNVTLFLDK